MRRLLLTAIAVLVGYDAALASGIAPGKTFVTYLHHNPQVVSLCGSPIALVTWTDRRHVRQNFQHGCQIRATFRVLTPTVPAPRPTSTPWPTPVPTATPMPSTDPVQRLLGEINAERASHGYASLTLSATMSNGAGACMGAIGHAQSMAQQGTIGHWDFPADVCGYPGIYFTAGENVGVSGGSELQAIDAIQTGMLTGPGETWYPGCSGNHHCNEDSPGFTHIGLAIVAGSYQGWPAYYVSEEFAG